MTVDDCATDDARPAEPEEAPEPTPYVVDLDERCTLDGARLRQWRDGTVTCPVCAMRQR